MNGRLDNQTILIVDDDEDIRDGMALAIGAEGARIITAGDGNAAVSLWRSHEPDAVVLDMMLPKRSGFLVLEELLDSDPPPVVIMVTANEGQRHETYARQLGVREYLVKPVPLGLLVDTLVNHLD